MRIGSGWTKTTESGDTYISIALDEVIGELYPQLKGCYINLWHVKKEDRKDPEKSPSWTVSLSVKQETENKKSDKEFDEIVPL